MLAPYRWIKDYADVTSGPAELAEKMVMTGSGVEGIEYIGDDIVNVAVGKIVKLEKHPDADKLQICTIDVGDGDPLQIVTGADNVFEGAMIPVAKAPATLPGGPIKKGRLRGVESCGMLCSGEELNLTEADYPGAGVDGIWILPEDAPLGVDIKEYLSITDAVIEFEIGANRPDCLSVLGIAREAAASDEASFSLPAAEYVEGKQKTENIVSVEVQDTDLCTRFVAAAVTDVKIGPSPEWMKVRLRAAGIRPINNIVDITNFVMIETGQPMHAYDARDIRDGKIIVRRAKKGEQMKTLDDTLRTFDDDMLLICDGQGPIGIAGIMGGLDSEIKDSTTTVVFEAAKFMYGNVRRTSRALGLSTESSMRFSKGVDGAGTMYAMQRALTLASELGAGSPASGMIDILNENLSPKVVKTTAAAVNNILGTQLTAKQMQQALTRVFISTGLIGDELVCTVPTFRGDIGGENDIAEEVARIYGYDNIPTSQARLEMKRGSLSPAEQKTDILKAYLTGCGFFEASTYSFAGRQDYEKLGLAMPDSVAILNPLGDDTAYMRTTLLPQMLRAVSHNLNHKNLDVRLFECARTYAPIKGQPLPVETPSLCMAVSGDGTDFFALKGILENVVQLLCGQALTCDTASLPFLHPGVSASLAVGDVGIGYMGALHPDAMQAFELPQQTYVAHIDLQALFGVQKDAVTYAPLPRFPAAVRDIAVIVDTDVRAGDLLTAIRQAAGKRAEDVRLFDVFEGGKLPEGKKSLAYSITLRAADATLTDEEIDKVVAKVLKVIGEQFGAVLRD